MGLSQPRIIYGVHGIAPYNRTTKAPYGLLKVIGSASLALSGDIEQLYGGSNKFAWAAETKNVSCELSAKVKAYPGFLFDLFLGATVTDVTTADTAGTISAMVTGTGALINSTTGLASVTVTPTTGAALLKFGTYVLKATSTTAVKLYLLSDVDILRGTDGAYVDDTLEVSGPHTVANTSGTTDIALFGLRLTGGSGTVALTVGDSVMFTVSPPADKSSTIVIGAAGAVMPDFGALLYAQKRSNGEMVEINAHRCVGIGLPIPLEEMAFSQPELKMICAYDSTLDRVLTVRTISPTTGVV